MTACQPHLSFSNGLGHIWLWFARDFPIAVCWAHTSVKTTMLEWCLFHAGFLDRATAQYPHQFHLFWHAHASAQPDHGRPHP
jgi:hypothetical protein